ncbi:MAG: 4Fe-4S dicluster domain-containing protein [Pseudomonadota bacterium]
MALAETIKPESTFATKVAGLAGEAFNLCFQCGKCSSGCPVSFAMDWNPHQIVRMVQYGMQNAVLSCSTIWVCASCQTCTTRCPNGVDVAHLMDCLRQLALGSAVSVAEPEVADFHRCFLDSLQSFGRVHELSMLGRYKIMNGKLLEEARRSLNDWRQGKLKLGEALSGSAAYADMRLGLRMLRQGKLRVLPRKIRGLKALKGIFADARRDRKS